MRHILIALDRDGTLNEDDNFYLGKSEAWRKQLAILPGVASGIRSLNLIPHSYVAVISNQSGVAIADQEFEGLTEERVHEVNTEIESILRRQGCRIDGFFFCPYVDNAYAGKAQKKGREIHPHYIQDGCRDLKPNVGLLERAATSWGRKLEKCDVYVIGDRLTDVQTGLNANGTGILVESYKTRELGDVEETMNLMKNHPGRVRIAASFDVAARTVAELATRGY